MNPVINTKIIDTILCASITGKILSDESANWTYEEIVKQLNEVQNNCCIDLSATTHITSSGINALIRLLTKTRILGGDIVIVGVNGTIEKLFDIAKLDEVFTVMPSTDEAINYFKQIK